MTLRAAVRRLASVAFTSVFIVALTLCATASVRAQVTPPPVPTDTSKKAPPRDSAFVRDSLLRVDSIRRQAALDSIPDQFPVLIPGTNGSFGSGTWVWDEKALLREGPLTLGDLLRRIPGVNAFRAGGYDQPEAVTSFGMTRGRVQVEVDGYVLDPLTSSMYDLAGIELINLVGVTVERHLDMIRIKLTTAQPVGPKPYTRLEVATGQPDINVFRAVFMVPKVIIGPLAAAMDRAGTDGTGRKEHANAFAGWLKWSWTNGKHGIQLEYRRHNLKREAISPWPTTQTRQDLVVRARQQIVPGVTAEVFAGHSKTSELTDTLARRTSTTEDDTVPHLERDVTQYGARAAIARGGVYASATMRMRDAVALPKQELELTGGYDGGFLHAGADFSQQSFKTGPSASTYDVRGAIGPFSGLGAFVEIASGDRGAAIYGDSANTTSLEAVALTKRSAMRVGATLQRFGIDGGGALLSIKSKSTAPFGLPFDSGFAVTPVGDATGFETWGRIGFFRQRVFADASYTYYTKSAGWTYLPTRSWRIAGEAHLSPLPSGNLEITARLESVFRGPMLVYANRAAPADSVNLQLEPLPQNSVLNGYLQIRIIDVRAFIQWEDMLGKGRLDIPGRLIPGPRMYYGVKWELFN